MLKKIKDSLKYIKLKDILSIFIFIIIIIPAMIYKIYLKIINKKIWLVCEERDAARDNGYHFYKYVRTYHKEKNIYYAIDKDSSDYNKVKKYGNIIQYGSLKHWLYYLSANKNISTQKAGNPAPVLFYVLHVYLNLFNNRIFLQHGITKDNMKWLYYNETKFKIFICGAQDEYEYIQKNFGYPNDHIKYTGLARFDNLYNNNINKKQILIIPTWRSWLGRDTNLLNVKQNFKETNYYINWSKLLSDKKFNDFIKKENIIVYFYPHIEMQKYINDFDINSKNIKIVDNSKIDIQTLLKESSLMITDFSSVYMDFAYMKKPIIYYQFDKEEYRKKQYQEGYFKYETDGFGPICETYITAVDRIIEYIKNDYSVEKKYLDRMDKFYLLHDQNNCKRIYDVIDTL